MSHLLNSLRSPSRPSDEHGVAELLEIVSKRSMSCTDAEKQELGEIAKNLREYNKPSNPLELLQKKLSNINLGINQNGNQTESVTSESSRSPNPSKPKLPGMQGIVSPWKDLARGISKLQSQFAHTPPSMERSDQSQQPSSTVHHSEPEPGLNRDFGATPTIALLPPETTEIATSTTNEKRRDVEFPGDNDDMMERHTAIVQEEYLNPATGNEHEAVDNLQENGATFETVADGAYGDKNEVL